MRLLAIRGRNLASLADAFEVNLAEPPLAMAGLFAITGPTGAGKSTILDALCLALFNRLPRLPGGSGALLGRDDDPADQRISTTDVRGVLRRGVGSGWAEADFVGRDGQRYRARWAVRRANNRPGGKLQAVEQSLLRLEDRQALGGTVTETRAEIERLLGLDFEQFRRAVLLAQGDFAAFLKAPVKDRSALLEQITGTEIYSRLSKAAYERAEAERRKLAALEEKRSGLAVLDADGRAALEVEAAAAGDAVRGAEAAAAAAGRACDWHRRLGELSRDLEAAGTEHGAALAARQAGEGERREFEAARRVQSLRPALEQCERSRREAVEAAAKAQSAEAALATAHTRHESAGERLATAERHQEAAEAAWLSLEPHLERALLLDTELARLEVEVRAAEAGRDRAVAQAESERAALAALEREVGALTAEIARRQQALTTRTAVAPVAAEWPRWQSTLARAGAALATLVDSRKRLAGRVGDEQPVALTRVDFDRSVADAESHLIGKKGIFSELSGRPVMASAQLGAARAAAERRRDRVRTLGALADAAARSVADRLQARAEAERQRDQSAADLAAAAAAESALALAQAGFAEAEAALHRLHLARSGEVESLRAGLAAGEPCLVCGAAEHPWAGRRRAVFDDLLAGQQGRVDQVRTELRALSEALGGHRSAAAAARRQAELAEQRCAAAEAALVGLGEDWRAADGPQVPDSPAGAGVAAVLAARSAEIEAELAGITGQEREAEAHRCRLAAADAAVAAAGAALEFARVLSELDAPFAGLGDWRGGWAADAGRFRRELAAAVAALLADQQALAGAERRRDGLGADRKGLLARVEAATTTQAHAVAGAQDLGEQRRQRGAERAGVLGGRAAAAVRQEAMAARREAGRAQAEAREGHHGAGLALARAVQQRDSALDDAARRRAAADEAAAAFAAALAAAGQEEESVRHLLRHDQAWLEATGARLAALDRALDTAAATLAERQRLLTRHQAVPEAPTGDAAEAGMALAAADSALKTARELVYALGVRIRQDDQARTGLAGMVAEIEAQRQVCELWGGLDQVIGSASGDKFRRFAQGLSLDQVLGHANAQLADLARRYRLERAAGSDLEIQVADQDMGDEVRSVHSLSGGETFLISLALALGLSSMAGGGAGIATLFIDEGFGALDSDSLDVALSCLEALQAGGRSVGVVSHVPAMIERIGIQVRVIAEGGGRSRVETVRRA